MRSAFRHKRDALLAAQHQSAAFQSSPEVQNDPDGRDRILSAVFHRGQRGGEGISRVRMARICVVRNQLSCGIGGLVTDRID